MGKCWQCEMMAYISNDGGYVRMEFLKWNVLEKETLMAYISSDRRHGERKFPKRENLEKEILMAYIRNSKMLLAKITKKRNFPKRKLYARNFGKMPEKS